MNDHHVISYSRVRAEEFAIDLYDQLLAGPPSIPAWLDVRKLRPGQNWRKEVDEAIRTCKSLIFVMTTDSVESQSVCEEEWTGALTYKKPVIPILLDAGAKAPFRLRNRQYISFSDNFEIGLAQVRNHIRWLSSPSGELQTLKDRLEDAEYDLQRTSPEQRGRVQDEIDALKEQIARQELVAEDPEREEIRRAKSIERGIQRERQPEDPPGGKTRTKFINHPPVIAPSYWQDRHSETEQVGNFLKDEALRLMTVEGRGGIGKTAMVCRLLKSLEGGKLPDEGGELSVDGIVYLSERGSRGVSVPYLFADLRQLLSDDVAEDLDGIYKDPQEGIEVKMHALLDAFPEGRYVLLLDNFEDKIDSATREINDAELRGALRTILEHPHHAIKVIVTTHYAPKPEELALVQPGLQRTLNMDEGLPSPYAEEILRQKDANGKLGLKTAPEELLDEVRVRTRGFPRALEALFAILAADRNTTLREVLDDAEGLLPENVVEVLVGDAFSRLDPVAQMVMQALAIYGYPVTPAAVDYLLLPHRLGGVDSAAVLGMLVNMQFVRREAGGRYYLHPVDRTYALSRVPEGETTDQYEMEAPPFTQMALLDRAADYLAQTRTPRESWKTIEDLAPQLQEFELRYAAQDYDTAANVLLEIDFDYLYRWGHYRLMTNMHERLHDRLSDPYLRLGHLGSLGHAYSGMGREKEAISYTEQALEIAREQGDRQGEGAALGNLGSSYNNLGRYQEAITYREQALEIAREIGNRQGEGSNLGGLGDSYNNQGLYQEAIAYREQALEIAREIGDRYGEGANLTSLANSYISLGRYQEAITYREQALEIAREIGRRGSETWLLSNLGSFSLVLDQLAHAKEHIDQSLDIARDIGDRRIEVYALNSLGELALRQGEWSEAQQLLEHAIRIADEMENRLLQRDTRMSLARGYLYSGDLSSARTTIQKAREYRSQGYNYGLLALVGVISLRAGASDEAKEAFQAAVTEAEAQLSYSEQAYGALDSKGLAQCGLALLTGDEALVPAATHAYGKARQITKAAGIVADVLRLFDALQAADAEGVLAEVREVAAAEPTSAQTREA
jgi:tetratricopeptide (TPR) repeat protein